MTTVLVARSTSAVCRWSDGRCGGSGGVQLNAEFFSVLALLSGSASTAAELDQLESSSLILSFPCLKRTFCISVITFTQAAVQLLGVSNLPSGAHIYKGLPKKLHAAQGLTDVGAHIHQIFQKSSAASEKCQWIP